MDPEEEALDLLLSKAFEACVSPEERREVGSAADIVRQAYLLRQRALPRRGG